MSLSRRSEIIKVGGKAQKAWAEVRESGEMALKIEEEGLKLAKVGASLKGYKAYSKLGIHQNAGVKIA